MFDTLRFWLARGIDGFRIDALVALVEDDRLRDNRNPRYRPGEDFPTCGSCRSGTSTGPRPASWPPGCARWSTSSATTGCCWPSWECRWSRPWPTTAATAAGSGCRSTSSAAQRRLGRRGIAGYVDRYWPRSRPGLAQLGAWQPRQPRVASRLGSAQARVAAMLLLTLPGTPILYQGDELGLEDVPIPDGEALDPIARLVPGRSRGPAPHALGSRPRRRVHSGRPGSPWARATWPGVWPPSAAAPPQAHPPPPPAAGSAARRARPWSAAATSRSRRTATSSPSCAPTTTSATWSPSTSAPARRPGRPRPNGRRPVLVSTRPGRDGQAVGGVLELRGDEGVVVERRGPGFATIGVVRKAIRPAQRGHRGPRRPREDHPGRRHAAPVRGVPGQPGGRGPGARLHGPGAGEGHHHPGQADRGGVPRGADQRGRHPRPRRLRRRGRADPAHGRRRAAAGHRR